MHPDKIHFFQTALIFAVGFLLFYSAGCAKKDNPVSVEGITETNLFPFAPGRIFVYTDYSLDTTNSQKIPSTVHREAFFIQGTTTLGGKSALRIIDSVYATTGVFSGIDTVYFALENDNLLLYEGNGWVTFFNKSAGLNTEYDAGQITENVFGVPVTVTFKATIFPKEAVTAPIGTVQAYKVQLKLSFTIGGINYNVLQFFYFADGFGIVKVNTPVQTFTGAKLQGNESLLVSKNF